MIKVVLSFVAVFCVNFCFASTIYVDADATGSNNGTSWTNAFTDLQNALGAASSGDQIWVAEGTYLPIDDPNPSFNDRTVYFDLISGVEMYGGFTGTEAQLSERNWDVNETILSGSIGSNQSTDNSFRVVYGLNVSSNTRLDGFIVEHGYGSNANGSYYGGGLLLRNGSLTVANCVFRNNYADDGGGAIAHAASGVASSGILTLENCRIHNNESHFGGALYLRGTLSNISNCLVDNNDGLSAVYINNGESVIDKTVVAGNLCGSEAAIRVGDFTNAAGRIYNSLIVGNFSTGFRSAVSVDISGIGNNELINCTIAGNRTTGADADAVSGGDNLTIANCILWGNVGGNGHAQLTPFADNPTNCIIEDGFSGGTNVISTDPGFIEAGIGLAAPFDTTGLNYHVASSISPAVNSGDNSLLSVLNNQDLNDSARISAGTIDIGCYEYYFCDAGNISITTSGPTDFCEGDFVVLSAPQASSYSWSNGATSQEITVSEEATYSVEIIDSENCFGSESLDVNVYPASVTINGSLSFCEGETAELTASSPNGSIFNWDSGQSGETIMVGQPGVQTVTVTTTNNCTASESVTVQEIAVPTPSIFQNGLELTSSAASGNQWYLNGNEIAGATGQTYTVTENGQYSVEVTENGCTSSISNAVNVNNVSVSELEPESITFHPNPATDVLHFSVPLSAPETFKITLINLVGQEVVSKKLSTDQSLSLTELKNGFYMLVLSNGETSIVRQIVKN